LKDHILVLKLRYQATVGTTCHQHYASNEFGA
jgi:hypothetical protein